METREQLIDILVARGYNRSDAEQLPTEMLIDMVAYMGEV